MSKKSFGTAPKPKPLTDNDILAFERGGKGTDTPSKAKPTEVTKRLSLDLPATMHTRFKTACTATGQRMNAEIIAFIEERTVQLEKEAGLSR